MSDAIAFRYTLTEADFLATLRANMLKRKPRAVLWFLVVMLLFIAMSGVWYLMDSPSLTVSGIVSSTVMAVIPAFVVWCLWWWQPKRVARGSPYLGVEIEGTATDIGMVQRSALGQHETGWAAYTHVLEIPSHYLFFLNRNVFTPFPKRGLADPEDEGRLRDLIRAHVPDARLMA